MTVLSFRDALTKAEPTPDAVHVATAGSKGKRVRSFGECVGKAEFKAGDRIKVRDGAAHPGMEEMVFGVVHSVSDESPLAIKFDGSDDIHQWYVGSEIEPAGAESGMAKSSHAPKAGAGGKKKPVADEMAKGIRFTVPITKADEDQNLVFGWASVIEENGEPVYDHQGHRISEDELEKAFYRYAEEARVAGEMHDDYGEHVGKLVEAMVFTKAKQAALGIDLGKVGAWVGYRVNPAVFSKIKDGTYRMLSIGGHSQIEDDE